MDRDESPLLTHCSLPTYTHFRELTWRFDNKRRPAPPLQQQTKKGTHPPQSVKSSQPKSSLLKLSQPPLPASHSISSRHLNSTRPYPPSTSNPPRRTTQLPHLPLLTVRMSSIHGKVFILFAWPPRAQASKTGSGLMCARGGVRW
jgi:hypothetical protein